MRYIWTYISSPFVGNETFLTNGVIAKKTIMDLQIFLFPLHFKIFELIQIFDLYCCAEVLVLTG